MNLDPSWLDISGVKAVIFDVDGTLVDSERDGHRVAFNRAFTEAGMADHWDEDVYGQLLEITGGRRRLHHYLLAQGHPPSAAETTARHLHIRKTAILCELIETGAVPLRPGVMTFVSALEAAGIELYVATTGSRAWVEPLLERHFGRDRFASVVTGTEVTALKPDPAVYLEVLRSSGHSPDHCLAIEDSHPGVTAAVAAGLRCVAISNDYTHHHDFSAAFAIASEFSDRILVAPAQDHDWSPRD